MKLCSYLLFFATLFAQAQSIQDCKKRFDSYLNFHSSLTRVVRFDGNSLSIMNQQGKKEFIIYEEELKSIAHFFEHSTAKQQEQFLAFKGSKALSKHQRDSLYVMNTNKQRLSAEVLKHFQGVRIALDPGHFATNLADAQVEQKFLFFVKDTNTVARDTIQLFESTLTFNTATILKGMLEEQGANVFLSREKADHTSFGCNFRDWMKNHKRRTLDSLKTCGAMANEKYRKLLKCNDYTFFWDFFRDYDLANRAKKINDFKPDLTAIIHYNVDEKNAPWKQHTKKNYSMAFIGGAFTADNLTKTESKMHFIRLLITDQLNRSESLAANTVLQFNSVLNIPIARSQDADYLKENCLPTSSPGVFCRNLVLCRKINSVLVYGESLYQDNENESKLLMRSDLDIYGVKTNDRVMKVARSYYNALADYLTKIKR